MKPAEIVECSYHLRQEQEAITAMAKAIVTFHEDGYHSETEVGSSDFK